MAARIPNFDGTLDSDAQQVIDAGGYRDTGEKLINAVSSLFNFVPKLYNSLKSWTIAVQDSEKVVYDTLGNMHNRMGEQDGKIADIMQSIERGDENLTKEIEGIKQAAEHSNGNLSSEVESIKKVIGKGDENITQQMVVVRGELQQMRRPSWACSRR